MEKIYNKFLQKICQCEFAETEVFGLAIKGFLFTTLLVVIVHILDSNYQIVKEAIHIALVATTTGISLLGVKICIAWLCES